MTVMLAVLRERFWGRRSILESQVRQTFVDETLVYPARGIPWQLQVGGYRIFSPPASSFKDDFIRNSAYVRYLCLFNQDIE